LEEQLISKENSLTASDKKEASAEKVTYSDSDKEKSEEHKKKESDSDKEEAEEAEYSDSDLENDEEDDEEDEEESTDSEAEKIKAEREAENKKLKAEAIQLAKYIKEEVDSRSYMPFVSPIGYQKEIGDLVILWILAKKDLFIKERLDQCQELSDLKQQGLDVFLHCESLRKKTLQYQKAIALGQEDGDLINVARKVQAKTNQYLIENTKWSELREELNRLDEELSNVIDLAAKQPHYALIRDSFSILSCEKRPLLFSRLHAKITECFLKDRLGLKDEQIEEWLKTEQIEGGLEPKPYWETVGKTDVVTLTPYAMGRVCWQALTTSPKQWSENFIRLFGLVVIPLIELALNPEDTTIDEYNKKFIMDSYSELLEQFKWLLSLAKNPEQSLPEICPMIFPANLQGFHFDDCDSLDKMSSHLIRLSTRGGRLREWMDGVNIDDWKCKDDDPDSLVALLLVCPLADRFKILKKGLKILSFGIDLQTETENKLKCILKIILIFNASDQHLDGKSDVDSVLDLIWRLFPMVDYLFNVVRHLPVNLRAGLILRAKVLIKTEQEVVAFLKITPPGDRHRLMDVFRHLFTNFEVFIKALEQLLPEGRLEELKPYHDNETEVDLGPDHLSLVLGLLPAEHRLDYIEYLLSKSGIKKEIFNHHNALDLLSEEDIYKLLANHSDLLRNSYALEKFFNRIQDKKKKYSLLKDNGYIRLVDKAALFEFFFDQVEEEKHPELVDLFYRNHENDILFAEVIHCLKEENRVPAVERNFHIIKSALTLLKVIKDAGIPLASRRSLVEKGLSLLESEPEKQCFPLILCHLSEKDAEELLEQHFSLIKDGTSLTIAVSNFSPDRRRHYLEKEWHLVDKAVNLGYLIFDSSSEVERDYYLEKGWNLVTNGYGLYDVVVRYPLKERRAVIERGWDLITGKNSKIAEFAAVLSLADPLDQVTLFAKGAHLFQEDNDFLEFFQRIFSDYARDGTQKSLIDEAMSLFAKSCKDPVNSVTKFMEHLSTFIRLGKKVAKAASAEKGTSRRPCTWLEYLELMKPACSLLRTKEEVEEVLSNYPDELSDIPLGIKCLLGDLLEMESSTGSPSTIEWHSENEDYQFAKEGCPHTLISLYRDSPLNTKPSKPKARAAQSHDEPDQALPEDRVYKPK
jgi:hypothetical protein